MPLIRAAYGLTRARAGRLRVLNSIRFRPHPGTGRTPQPASAAFGLAGRKVLDPAWLSWYLSDVHQNPRPKPPTATARFRAVGEDGSGAPKPTREWGDLQPPDGDATPGTHARRGQARYRVAEAQLPTLRRGASRAVRVTGGIPGDPQAHRPAHEAGVRGTALPARHPAWAAEEDRDQQRPDREQEARGAGLPPKPGEAADPARGTAGRTGAGRRA